MKIQILIACWALLLTPLSFAHSGATGVVKERMDRMVQMGKSVKAVSEMIKGKQPFSPEAVVDHAQRLAQSAEDMTDGFPEGSLKHPSEALPAVWERWAEFSQLADELELELTAFAEQSQTGDFERIKQQFVKVADSCRNCHADFRKKKKPKHPKPIVVTKLSGHIPVQQQSVAPVEPLPISKPDPLKAADPVSRGEYLFILGGCASCHSPPDEQELAGGLKMETPFGVFYSPNISPDPQTGIGDWSDQQFIQAMRDGIAPDGSHYYPAFPYISYSKMSEPELVDLKAYLDSRPAIRKANRPHELGFPFNQRPLLAVWKWLFFDPQPVKLDSSRSDSWNRGAYIVNGPGHCVECHTPRNLFGAMKRDRLLAGNPAGPEGEEAPSINGPDSGTFRYWTITDTEFGLETGITPEGDALGGSMAHVVKNTTSQLTAEDLRAIAEYLASPRLEETD